MSLFELAVLTISIADEPVYNSAANRRKSVFAEAYNPEDDDGDDTKVNYSSSSSVGYKKSFGASRLDLMPVFVRRKVGLQPKILSGCQMELSFI